MTYKRYIGISKSLLEAIIVLIMIGTAGKNYTSRIFTIVDEDSFNKIFNI